eukprot:7159899-Prymnesium_polylepis.2
MSATLSLNRSAEQFHTAPHSHPSPAAFTVAAPQRHPVTVTLGGRPHGWYRHTPASDSHFEWDAPQFRPASDPTTLI